MDNIMIYSLLKNKKSYFKNIELINKLKNKQKSINYSFHSKNKKVLSTVKVIDKLLILIKNKYIDDIIIKINDIFINIDDNLIKLKYYNKFNILSLLNKYHVNNYKFIRNIYIGCVGYELIIDINNLNVIFDLYIDFVNHFI